MVFLPTLMSIVFIKIKWGFVVSTLKIKIEDKSFEIVKKCLI